MRAARVSLAVLILALATPPSAGAGPSVVAAGAVAYDYENASPTAGVVYASCRGAGVAAVEYDAVTRRAVFSIVVPGCTPSAGVLTGCAGGEGIAVACAKDGPASRVRLSLAPDGAFSLEWIEPGFAERATGTLTRA